MIYKKNQFDLSLSSPIGFFARVASVLFLTVFVLLPVFGWAQSERSYYYDKISQKFTVNKDTTVDVEEIQTYNFTGEYHKGWRSISFNKVSDITDVLVFDGATGLPLQHVSSSLEKTDPNSWGKYTYRKSGRNLEIEWYYNAKDVTRFWILKYKLIGALSFLKDEDELYWNLFTDYDVPVKKAEATVIIPPNYFSVQDLKSKIYISKADNPIAKILDEKTFYFSAENVSPEGDVTIAGGWPKGVINRNQFWIGWFKAHYVFIFSVLIIISTIISMILYWYLTERRGKGRGTIIPKYEPPKTVSGERIPPAMADLLVHEKLSPKAWAATVIDLAVRGYVKITEEKPILGKNFLGIIFLIPIIFVLFFLTDVGFLGKSGFAFAIIPILMIISLFGKGNGTISLVSKDYIVERIKESDGDLSLHEYERSYLAALLHQGRFSTREMRRNLIAGREMYKAIKEIGTKLLEETDNDTKAFEKPLSKEKYLAIGVSFLVFISVCLFWFVGAFVVSGNQWAILVFISFVCAFIMFLYVKFEARLTNEGAILREDWLGFKMYLETAEKYRMQNLTPETFEKYLPYAIIFGVEKKWGNAFEGILMQPPTWYHGAYIGGVASGSGSDSLSSGFSASAFSASFSSSFSSEKLSVFSGC
jgi:hypothetical protein